jgi:hypothetical protein
MTPSPVWLISTSTVDGLTAATISAELGLLEPPVSRTTTTTRDGDEGHDARDAGDERGPLDRAPQHDPLDARRRGRRARLPAGGAAAAGGRGRAPAPGAAAGGRRRAGLGLWRHGAVAEVELGLADPDALAPAQRHRARDALPVDIGAVGGAEILEYHAAVGLRPQQRMATRGLGVGQRQIAVRAPADEEAFAGDVGSLALPRAGGELDSSVHAPASLTDSPTQFIPKSGRRLD